METHVGSMITFVTNIQREQEQKKERRRRVKERISEMREADVTMNQS